MRIITYSDLHLEFGSGWTLPPDANGDVIILAGDIITLRDYGPLDQELHVEIAELVQQGSKWSARGYQPSRACHQP